jgi:hypothetical protein
MSLTVTCALVCVASPAYAQQVLDADSLERIRQALLRPPPRLSLELRRADFFVYVEQRRPLSDIFDRPPWVSPPPEFPPPPGSNRDPHDAVIAGVSFDPYAVAHSVSRAIRTHQARGEVQRVIAEYCRAHGNEPGADAICRGVLR